MDLDKTAEFLSSVDLFCGVTRDVLTDISSSMHVIELPLNTKLFSQGETGDAVFIVVDGTLDLVNEGIKLVSRHKGECVGEMALIDAAPRSADAIAGSDVTLLRWERAAFQDALTTNPQVASGVITFGTFSSKSLLMVFTELVMHLTQ